MRIVRCVSEGVEGEYKIDHTHFEGQYVYDGGS